jgi:hypothetical protein
LRKKVQIWWVKNDTAAYRKSENDSCIYDIIKNIFAFKSADLVGQKCLKSHIASKNEQPRPLLCSTIPQTALVAALDTYDFIFIFKEPSFIICAYDANEDIFISKSLLEMNRWEASISSLLRVLLQYAAKMDLQNAPIFLDCGANFGSHALYGAAMGYDVWAIEPQRENLFRVSSAQWWENDIL